MYKIKTIATLIFFICSSSSLYAGKESPMLAKMVKSGKLPPLEQRLPKNPLVEKPVSEIGKYGGKYDLILILELLNLEYVIRSVIYVI